MNIPWITITEVEHITPELLQHALDVTEDFYAEEPLNRFDFIDRVETRAEVDLGIDIDSPAIKHLLKMARKHKKEINA
jgi:hypothetical protein